ncbi:zona pellucida sperm-binding protein 4-like [Denticeps clupeoides]|uniref:zona pellucida sperm-binding protein 4-like n=1 Tax=Denticeps clupeoides TaxID=299321 RepID=UPI0010A44212|nr:zona pellucida sperm-binding protein 4-like [Denticeps clupeoides]
MGKGGSMFGVLVLVFWGPLCFAQIKTIPAPSGPQIPTLARDPGLPLSDQCQVNNFERVPCGAPGISASNCSAIRCCFDGQQCYYGKMVTVQCTRDGQFVLVVAMDATLPRLSLDSVTLLGGSSAPCAAVDSNGAFAIFQFPVTACGTLVMVESGYVIYENRMFSSYEVGVGPLGSITRDSQFELLFQCRYFGAAVEAVVVQTGFSDTPLPVAALGPLQVELRLANGHCAIKGCVEGTAPTVAYNSYYSGADYPVTKVLRDPVYAEVRIVGRTDPNLVLMLGRCWATSSPNPFSSPQWDILVNGCPYQDDRYLTTLVPVSGSSVLQYPMHYKRFILQMFTFVNPTSYVALNEKVFLHCNTAVCYPSATSSCQQTCGRQRRSNNVNIGKETLVSSGEVHLGY